MQLILIFGITIAIGAVMFALQNNVPVRSTLPSGVSTVPLPWCCCSRSVWV